jgi:uncharacterized protein YjbI with pentapeptide repeats
MSDVLQELAGQEFIRRVLAGERDFAATRLTLRMGPLDEEDGYAELVSYLRQQDLRASPINAELSDWHGLQAPGLFLQSGRFAGANLSAADLRGADLRRSDFTGTTFEEANLSDAELTHSRFIDANLSGALMRNADLYEANLTGAILRNADLSGAFLLRLSLQRADVSDASFLGTELYRVDLRGVIGLDKARDLGRARFHRVIVTAREREIIVAALRELPLFELREE